jgi:hypothetical protein
VNEAPDPHRRLPARQDHGEVVDRTVGLRQLQLFSSFCQESRRHRCKVHGVHDPGDSLAPDRSLELALERDGDFAE